MFDCTENKKRSIFYPYQHHVPFTNVRIHFMLYQSYIRGERDQKTMTHIIYFIHFFESNKQNKRFLTKTKIKTKTKTNYKLHYTTL
jgi:hypothetical protein